MKNSSGNMLFVILIAVALFAALSYAVVLSNRGGPKNSAVDETSTLNASVLGQYVASIRASIQRMTTDNHDITTLEFNAPADFNNLTTNNVGVFHPSGGAVIYEMAQDSLIDKQGSNLTGQWVFTMNFEVKDIGTSKVSSLDGNELIAFMVGIRKDVCEQLNKRLGISTNPLPHINNIAYSTDMITNINSYYMDNDYVLPTTEMVIGAGASDSALAGKSEGCYYEDSGKNYVYYGVLSER